MIHNREIPEDDRIENEDVISFLERFFIDTEEYDVVIGYRADDAYFRFPLMFVRNVLTYEKLEEIYMLGNLGKQYVIKSEKAFGRMKFVDAISAEPSFFERYHRRKDGADNSYRELERIERASKGTRVRDLMAKEND